ncbi:LPXTG cell wall anchor domain-containing protein [Actinoplanes sp. N902-109]|uniref:LPXTG cell wall anchor domain-containing protein n=1 Tax=Actinoplanes sp. (strain N902-109) TaxID=649831 RepID=UPI00032962ED|nr:LPXTG cell wall anchor domain-containing protein [Actinoplanes sp. N902-109]AGL18418.1 cell wall anchor domain-containing protein [Actinoplanes sp. N902-109]
MVSTRLRHVLAGLAGLALTAVAAPLPVSAAPAGPQLSFEHMTIVPGGIGEFQVPYYAEYGTPFTLHDVKATIDTSALPKTIKAELALGQDEVCKTAGTQVTCTYPSVVGTDGFWSFAIMGYQAVKGAVAGDEGSVKLTISSKELGTATRTAKITVADQVEMLGAEGESLQSLPAKPGGTVGVPLSVQNLGDNTINGVELFFWLDEPIGTYRKYSNCWWGTSMAYCHFDTDLAPGAVYDTTLALSVSARSPAPTTLGGQFDWQTPEDNRDHADIVKAQHPVKGTAGTLTLKPRAAAARRVPQTNLYPFSYQTRFVDVEGDQRADLAAVGAEVSGEVGSTVTAEVGVTNVGKAYFYDYPEPGANITVTAPSGTTVVKTPPGCARSGKGYLCTTIEAPLAVGKPVTWPFQLRIDRAGTLTGKVEVRVDMPDTNAANDKAALVVGQVTAGDPAPGSGPGSGGSSGGQGGGGGLPVTGANAAIIGGAGGLLVIGGVVAFVLSRRRKDRFVA